MYPYLLTFMGGYLNQDHQLDYGSVEDAIGAFLAESTAAERAGTLREIDQLINTPHADSEVGEMLRNLSGCGYDPLLGGAQSYRDWLRGIRDQMRLAESPPA
jgi:hypothetical protein